MRNGSLQNLMMTNAKSKPPVVGDGATEIGWTDRRAYTVVEVLSDKRIVVQRDSVRRADDHGMAEDQRYLLAPDANGEKVTLSLRSNGKWAPVGQSSKGNVFLVGVRQEYYDHSF